MLHVLLITLSYTVFNVVTYQLFMLHNLSYFEGRLIMQAVGRYGAKAKSIDF